MPEHSEAELWSKIVEAQQTIAEVKENVRHNGKAIDRVERKLDQLINTVATTVATKEELRMVSQKADNIVWRLLIPAIAGIAGGITVRLLAQFLPG